MKQPNKVQVTQIESYDASLINLQLPQHGNVKILFYQRDKDITAVRELAQSIADDTNVPVAMVPTNISARKLAASHTKYGASEMLAPTGQARLVASSYGVRTGMRVLPVMLERIWGMLAIGIAVIHSSRRITFINEPAAEMMRQIGILGYSATGQHMHDEHQFAEHITNCTRKRQAQFFSVGCGYKEWQVTAMPLSRAYAVVFMFDCLLSENDCDNLRKRYNLTIGESKFLAQFVKTPDTKEMAEHLHISVPTVRTQMRNIHEKVGTNNQAKLMKLLISGAIVSCADSTGRSKKKA